MDNEIKKAKFILGKDENIYRLETKANECVCLSFIDGTPGFLLKDEDFIKQESDSLVVTKTPDGSIRYSLL